MLHCSQARRVQNLRIAVLLNPRHPEFTARLEANPALLCSMHVHWMESISDSQQLAIASDCMRAALGDTAQGEAIDAAAQHLLQLHKAAGRHVSVTPQHFKTLASQTESVLLAQQAAISAQLEFLQVRTASLGHLLVLVKHCRFLQRRDSIKHRAFTSRIAHQPHSYKHCRMHLTPHTVQHGLRYVRMCVLVEMPRLWCNTHRSTSAPRRPMDVVASSQRFAWQQFATRLLRCRAASSSLQRQKQRWTR